ncbi:SGNH hydrolase domain-containing protein [Nocardioides nanhaiensis]|uniref:SGNH domain-containing protein n=1 Tax=Nocardioides nanhaiensis TaxID=1476871 RepID=A0ABP8WC93_9ACTN
MLPPGTSPQPRTRPAALLLALVVAVTTVLTTGALSSASAAAPAAAPAAGPAAGPAARANPGLPLPERCLVRPGKCEIGPQKAGAPTLVLWGDSHAWQHLRGIQQATAAPRRHVNLVVFLYGGCPPMDQKLTPAQVRTAGPCAQTNHRALAYVQRLHRQQRPYRVLLGSGWEIFRYALSPLPDGAAGWRQPTSDSVANAARLGRTGTPALFRTLGRMGAPVDVIGQMVTVPTNAPACAAGFNPYRCTLPRSAALAHFAENMRQIRQLRGMLTRPSLLVQPSRLLCDTRRCRSTMDGRSVYANPAHITKPVAGRLQRYFAPTVGRLLG